VLLPERGFAESISPDGKLVILRAPARSSGGNTMLVASLAEAPSAGSKPRVFLDTKSIKLGAQFSPDGRLIAYYSNDSGQNEIYVQSYPGPGVKSTVSAGGGTTPRWARSGRELFYRDGDKMMAVDVEIGPAFRVVGKPKVLFQGRYRTGYDVSPDSKRFLMVKNEAAELAPTDQLNIVVNWLEELRRRAPLSGK
jgi:hypothetical protein